MNPLSHLINDSLQRFEKSLMFLFRSNHAPYYNFLKRSGDGKKFIELVESHLIASNLSVIQAMKEKCLGMQMKHEHSKDCEEDESWCREYQRDADALNHALSTISNWLQEAEDLISNKKI